jgi:hypothetical protein
MDADRYLKEAEKCERLAKTCVTEICRAFWMDAADHWRRRALEARAKNEAQDCSPLIGLQTESRALN